MRNKILITFAATLTGAGIAFFLRFYISKQVSIEEFGKLSLVLIFTGLIPIISNLGLNNAYIQNQNITNKKSILKKLLIHGFVFGLVLFLFYILIVNEIILLFYNENLQILLIVGSSFALILPVKQLLEAKFSRDLNFTIIAKATIFSSLVSFILVFFFSDLLGVYTIILYPILGALVFIIILNKQLVEILRVKTSKNINELKRFSKYDLKMRLFIYFTQNIDNLSVSYLLGMKGLAQYSMAYLLTDVVRQNIFVVVSKISLPLFSKNTIEDLKKNYMLTIELGSLAIMPLMVIYISYVSYYAPIYFSKEWLDFIIVSKILAISCILHTISGPVSVVFKAIDKPDLDYKIYLYKTLLVTVPAVILLTWQFGIIGTAISIVVHKTVGRIVYQKYINKLIGVSNIEILKCISQPIGISVIIGSLQLISYSTLISNSNIIHFLFLTSSVIYLCCLYSLFNKASYIRVT